MRPLIKSTKHREVRILRPAEFEHFRSEMEEDMQRACTTLLLTGMRYAELWRFGNNPSWLEGRWEG